MGAYHKGQSRIFISKRELAPGNANFLEKNNNSTNKIIKNNTKRERRRPPSRKEASIKCHVTFPAPKVVAARLAAQWPLSSRCSEYCPAHP